MTSEREQLLASAINELGAAVGRIEHAVKCQALLAQFLVNRMIDKRKRKEAKRRKKRR